jgi:predicted alpha/beta hydrolase family esterase
MRVAERNKVRGIVLVAGYDDDLGDAGEKASGYFDEAFDYEKIAHNCQKEIECVIGMRDSLVPADVQLALAKKLRANVSAIDARDHFFTPPAEEIFDAVKRLL